MTEGIQEVCPIFGQILPSMSCSIKRPTRVPASSVVRIKIASNIMAKWYQSASIPLPKALPKILAIPTAKLGAPPVRANRLLSPMSFASWLICSTLTANPQLLIFAMASTASLPTTPAGLLIAKNTPGSKTVAAIIAIIATKLSSNIAP